MILLFDVGNTSIYVGIANETEIVSSFRINTDLNKTPDEYYMTIKKFTDNYKITGISIGSVVPLVTLSLISVAEDHFKVKPVVVQPGIKTGLFVKADNPKEVGADLIADAVGLDNGKPTLIIDLGTAIKFIYVKENKIEGVIISPGIHLQINSLAESTALLHEVEVKVPDKYLANNTIQCIQSGVILGTIAMIEGMSKKIREEVKEDFKTVITGGLSELFVNHIDMEITHDPELVLKGLLKIYNKNN